MFLLVLPMALAFGTPIVAAQGLDAGALLKPATDTWPSYNGDYSGRRYSTLDQINAGNIHSLTLAWAFNTRGSVLKSTPLEVNGILYFSAPDNVWAVDARFGRMIWHYQRPSEGDHIGHRGLGMHKDWLYFTTPDAHLISLDAKDGKVRWDVELADAKLGYFATMAPLVIRDHVITGVSGDVTDVRGYLKSIDPETGST
jgi:alcohol dehydrogenase (cytochrome c)